MTTTTRTIRATKSRALIHQPNGEKMLLIEATGITLLDSNGSRRLDREQVIQHIYHWFGSFEDGDIIAFPHTFKIFSPDGDRHIIYESHSIVLRDSDGVAICAMGDDGLLGVLDDWFGEMA